jgi:tripartite ATP-independent transporter DctP family solute receptor
MTNTSSRRSLIKAAGIAGGLSALGVSPFARAAEFTYKLGTFAAANHPLTVRLTEAAARIEKESNGRLIVQIYPSNQLGSDGDSLSQLRSGGLEFTTLSGVVLSTLVPPAAINGVGFAFKDYDVVWKAMDGDLGKYVREQIGKTSIIAMDKIFDNGFRPITSNAKPIQTPADMVGLKLRVPAGPLWTSMFKTLGASPTMVSFAELYTALQTKVVDAQETPLALIESNKFYEVQKYCSLTNHMWDGMWLLANKKMFEALPPELQKIARRNFDIAAVDERADIAALNTRVQKDLTAKGMVFNQPNVKLFQEALVKGNFYSEWKGKFGADAWAILEKYSGKLG